MPQEKKIAIQIPTRRRDECIDITGHIEQAVASRGIREGLCIVFCPHTTAGLAINENADPSVKKDILVHMEKLVPGGAGYTHREGNADAHIKSVLTGCSLQLIITEGTLFLGTWQGIYFCEFDGPRNRTVYIKLIEG